MISVESQVLQCHLAFFEGKSVLFAGGIRDDFPAQLRQVREVNVWSWYFDYAQKQSDLPPKSWTGYSRKY
ncbi:MAG: hypothetical protein SO424_04830 [[Pasteurella] aerogenes]|nr:hypothetical protein [[Pasteurella] aerogenes]